MSNSLRNRYSQAELRLARLEGTQQTDTQYRDDWTRRVSEAKGRLSLNDEVVRLFEALQNRAHARSVGGFERLLSAILEDVIPDEGKIRLLTHFKNNTTWLDVALEKGGNLEDVFDGNGGAITNVVCTGLRFAALSRTQNRRVMILDEPDCWIRGNRIPAFMRVIAEVSKTSGTQTFMISHHDPSLGIEGNMNVVKFYVDESGKIAAKALAPLVSPWESDDQPGIREIELINFRSHTHTKIPCFPGATGFVGPNNLGKSAAIVSSAKALAYGESDDTMIKHGCDEAKVIWHLEKGRSIEWSRVKKRNPAVLYRLFEAGNPEPVLEGRQKTRNQAPDWVVQLLGVQRVSDMDIQIGNQKSPVFLLDDTASRRAELLSVGREASHLKSLMQLYEGQKSTDRETVKAGESSLSKLNYRLSKMERLSDLKAALAKIGPELQTLERIELLQGVVARMEQATQTLALVRTELAVLETLPAAPCLADTQKLDAALLDIETRQRRISNCPELPALPVVPELADLEGIMRVGKEISNCSRRIQALSQLPAVLPELPKVQDISQMEKILAALTDSSQRLQLVQTQATDDNAKYQAAERELESLKTQLGVCPLCQTPFKEDTHVGH